MYRVLQHKKIYCNTMRYLMQHRVEERQSGPVVFAPPAAHYCRRPELFQRLARGSRGAVTRGQSCRSPASYATSCPGCAPGCGGSSNPRVGASSAGRGARAQPSSATPGHGEVHDACSDGGELPLGLPAPGAVERPGAWGQQRTSELVEHVHDTGAPLGSRHNASQRSGAHPGGAAPLTAKSLPDTPIHGTHLERKREE